MFAKKSEDPKPAAVEPAAAALPQKSGAPKDAVPAMPAPRKPVMRPEVVRAPRDYSSLGSGSAGGGSGREELGSYRSSYGEGKKLIVGRDIALSGQISSCEKLVVEGRVEANIADCREIEIAETGTFKGEAEVEVAEISGSFDGTLIARGLLLVRAQGRITGTVRYGRLEIERGGQINGDVRVFEDGSERRAEVRASAGE